MSFETKHKGFRTMKTLTLGILVIKKMVLWENVDVELLLRAVSRGYKEVWYHDGDWDELSRCFKDCMCISIATAHLESIVLYCDMYNMVCIKNSFRYVKQAQLYLHMYKMVW